jgi:PAS domain S-box-containing protein
LLILVVVISSFEGAFPVFFVNGSGSTLIRQLVLDLSAILLAFGGLLFVWMFLRTKSPALYWYALGIASFIVSLIGSSLTVKIGDGFNWVGRTGLYLMGAYFLTAIIIRSPEPEGESNLYEKWAKAFSTDRKQLFTLFTNLPLGVVYGKIITDPEGKPKDLVYLDMNGAYESVIGIKKEKVLGKSATEVLPGLTDKLPDWIDPYVRSALDGESTNYEMMWPYSGKWYSTTIYSPQKSFFVAIMEDVTERKKVEESLKENEFKYRGLFENMHDLVVLRKLVFDAKGEIIGTEILDANLAALNARGITELDALRNKDDRELYSPDMAAVVLDQARRMKAEGKSVTEEIHFDTNDRDYLSTFAPLGHDLLITTSIDITDRKKIEDNLKRSNEELQQFAYLSSHDLQEPLRMVISYMSLLEKRYKDQLDPKAQEYIKNAIEGGARMRLLIDDLLAYSRLDTTGKAFVHVNMNETLDSTIKVLKVSIEESKADIFVGPLPTIIADELQMSQLMQNLIGNAIKFHGSERPMVQIVAKSGVREWTFSVKDNGIGLNTEYSDKIFQMFQRLHTKDRYPGTGVGLAIAKKIVERHGGRIWVESEEGKGATFFFTIPKIGGGQKVND